MKKIAFHNQKGGVGKSTLSAHVAWALAEEGARTVLVDGDPQGNTTTWLLNGPPARELADVLAGKCTVVDAMVEIVPKLMLMPTFAIGGDLPTFNDPRVMAENPYLFEDLCENIRQLDTDVVIFDLSPGLGALEKMVLKCVDEVVVPVTAEYFSLDGIQVVKAAIEDINRRHRVTVGHRRIVANMVNKSFRRHRDIHEIFEEMDYELFTVPQDSRMAEAQLDHQTVFTYAPRSRVIPELRRLAAAVGV